MPDALAWTSARTDAATFVSLVPRVPLQVAGCEVRAIEVNAQSGDGTNRPSGDRRWREDRLLRPCQGADCRPVSEWPIEVAPRTSARDHVADPGRGSARRRRDVNSCG